MLHDQLQELTAAKVLQDSIEALENDPNIAQEIKKGLKIFRSRMHHFYAQHYLLKGNRQKVLHHLDLGIKSDPLDADVLIAMFRVADADDAWRKKTLKLIDIASGHFQEKTNSYQQKIQQIPQRNLSDDEGYLASYSNQFAWLVSNTTGDLDEALRLSHLSIELRSDTAGYYDTLGRCYYAKKDFVKAVKYQTKANKLDSHSGQIKRQLKLFQKALADSQTAPEKESP